MIKWYDGYKKQEAQKASIKKELDLLLGIHQDGGTGVFLKTIKKSQKNCF